MANSGFLSLMFAVAFAGTLAHASRCAAQNQATHGNTTANDALSAGEIEFQQLCTPCHGMTGVGNGPVARALIKKPTNVRLLTRNNGGVFPEQKVRDFIDGRKTTAAHGSREMPIWGAAFQAQQPGVVVSLSHPPLSEEQVKQRIDQLVAYIRSIQSE